MKHCLLSTYVQNFFAKRLISQMDASANTVSSYRDTFRLLLDFAVRKLNCSTVDLQVTDIDDALVSEFLAALEQQRRNSVCTRNLRRSAIRSFFQFVAQTEPALLQHCQRVLAIPAKRTRKPTIDYLDAEECRALLRAPDLQSWYGRRDRALLLVALQTGLRVSELIGLDIKDVALGSASQSHVSCQGKGRKGRATPLRDDVAAVLREWLKERNAAAEQPLFVSNRGTRLSRDAVERIVRKHVQTTSVVCATLENKRVSPHTLRHSAAMALLRNGVSCTVIAMWLGHESVETTQIYLHADMEIKRKAMDQTRPANVPKGSYRPNDDLKAFLESL